MSKLQKNIMILLGITMCVAAVTMVLELINLSIYDFVPVIAGVALLVYDRFTRSAIVRNIGLVLLLPGCAYVLLRVLPVLYSYSFIVYALAFFLLFMVFYILYRHNVFAVLTIIDFLGICAAMASWFSSDTYEMYGYIFMAISAVLLILYFIKRTKIGLLPLIFAIFSYFCGLVNFLASAKIIDDTVHSVSGALILLVAGLTVIIYSIHKAKDKED